MLSKFQDEQKIVHQILSNAIKKDKLSHAYLFETKGYSKALDLAKAFVMKIECPDNGCGTCDICTQILSDNFLDLKIIDPEGLHIKKQELEKLQHEFSRKPTFGSKKVYIINNAEKLNASSSNSILKFLEEPEENIIAILITENAYNLLDTIVSRCQLISFKKEINENMNEDILIKIGKLLYNDESKIKLFSDDEKNKNRLEMLINFFVYFEKNKKDLILFTDKYFHSEFKNKEDISTFFKIAIYLYQDVLNIKIGRDPYIFKNIENLELMASNNSELNLTNKISLLIEYSEKIKYNINSKLLIDKLILDLLEV